MMQVLCLSYSLLLLLGKTLGESKLCNKRRVLTSNASYLKQRTQSNIQMCISQCLDLETSNKKCQYSEHAGNAIGDKCEKNFFPSKSTKYALCHHWLPMEPLSTSDREKYVRVLKKLATMCNGLLVELSKYDSKYKKLDSIVIGDIGLELLYVARKLGLQLILIVGSNNENHVSGNEFRSLTKDEKSRAKFLNELLAVVEKFQLSGVCFQWYYPGCHQESCTKKTDKENIIEMSKEIFLPMRDRGLKIFFTIPMDYEKFLQTGDYMSAIMPHVDYFIADTANMTGLWSGILDWDNSLSIIQGLLSKISDQISNKDFLKTTLIRINVQSKAYEFTDVQERKHKASIVKSSKLKEYLDFSEYCQYARNTSFTFLLDAANQNIGYLGTRAFVFDNSKSLEAKADYIRQKLAGFVLIGIHNDDAANECGCGEFPYLRTLSEWVNGRECIFKPCF